MDPNERECRTSRPNPLCSENGCLSDAEDPPYWTSEQDDPPGNQDYLNELLRNRSFGC